MYDRGVRCVRTRKFEQGKTLRWGLAWSFSARNIENIPLPNKMKSELKMDSLNFKLKVNNLVNLSKLKNKAKNKSIMEIMSIIEKIIQSKGCEMVSKKENKIIFKLNLKERNSSTEVGQQILSKVDIYECGDGNKDVMFSIREDTGTDRVMSKSKDETKLQFCNYVKQIFEDIEILII